VNGKLLKCVWFGGKANILKSICFGFVFFQIFVYLICSLLTMPACLSKNVGYSGKMLFPSSDIQVVLVIRFAVLTIDGLLPINWLNKKPRMRRKRLLFQQKFF